MDTIRMALAAASALKRFGRPPRADEQERHAILDKQIKQRRESAELFRAAQPHRTGWKEEREAQILAAYLPARLTDDEIREVVAGLIAEHRERLPRGDAAGLEGDEGPRRWQARQRTRPRDDRCTAVGQRSYLMKGRTCLRVAGLCLDQTAANQRLRAPLTPTPGVLLSTSSSRGQARKRSLPLKRSQRG